MSSPTSVNVKNVSIVGLMKLPSQRINTDKLKTAITTLQAFNLQLSIKALIGADNPVLHMYTEMRIGKENELVALKTKLSSVIFGGNKNRSKTLSVVVFSKECNLDEMVLTCLEIESCVVSEKQSSSILPETVQQALNILQKTTVNKNSQYTVGLLWDSDDVLLTNSKDIALSRLFSLERKSSNNI